MSSLEVGGKKCSVLAVVAEHQEISAISRKPVPFDRILNRREMTVQNFADRAGERLITWMKTGDDLGGVAATAGMTGENEMRLRRNPSVQSRSGHFGSVRVHPFTRVILTGKLDLDLSGREVNERFICATGIVGVLVVHVTGQYGSNLRLAPKDGPLAEF